MCPTTLTQNSSYGSILALVESFCFLSKKLIFKGFTIPWLKENKLEPR